MTERDRDQTEATVVHEGPAVPLAAQARRPYRAPKLTYLGSVRELTLGRTAGRRVDPGNPRRR